MSGDARRLVDELCGALARVTIEGGHAYFETQYNVLLSHIERIERELEEARANYAFMVDRAAQREPTLDGYRELGAKCAQLEQKLDEAQRSRDQYRNDALGCTARIAELEAENAKLRGQQSTSFTDEDECVWERDAARNP